MKLLPLICAHLLFAACRNSIVPLPTAYKMQLFNDVSANDRNIVLDGSARDFTITIVTSEPDFRDTMQRFGEASRKVRFLKSYLFNDSAGRGKVKFKCHPSGSEFIIDPELDSIQLLAGFDEYELLYNAVSDSYYESVHTLWEIKCHLLKEITYHGIQVTAGAPGTILCQVGLYKNEHYTESQRKDLYWSYAQMITDYLEPLSGYKDTAIQMAIYRRYYRDTTISDHAKVDHFTFSIPELYQQRERILSSKIAEYKRQWPASPARNQSASNKP